MKSSEIEQPVTKTDLIAWVEIKLEAECVRLKNCRRMNAELAIRYTIWILEGIQKELNAE